ncbi:hypothetical protein WR25_18194 [Diploscapter pachys]|uniref:Uncharacterized protein n=1 Tax=Diploscapter pachys TaxID=2018661 RepID=A0A2A2JI03_9BILA|nr:hypothetical protein WR25_18194 [Diploscapter pachys]
MSAQMIAAGDVQPPSGTGGDSMTALEERAKEVAQQHKTQDGNIAFVRGASKTQQQSTTESPEEIDIQMDEDDEDENGQQAVEGWIF